MPFLKDRSKVKMPRSKRLEIQSRRHGLRHKIVTPSGDEYKGEWGYNKKQGKGILLEHKGTLYEGDFYNDLRDGFGVLSTLMSNKKTFTLDYRGEWREGHMHGKGLRIYEDHSFYIGQFKRSERNGYGQYWMADCTFYDGDWLNDKFHGDGMFIFQNGNRYEGKWANGLKHGKGRYFHVDSGQMQEGVWYKDSCVYSIITDIPYRHRSIYPTRHPINKIELLNVEELCQRQEELALKGLGNMCDI